MSRMTGRIGSLLSGVALTACSVVGIRETPEPAHRVVDHVGAVEIREYAPRIAAETTVAAGEMAARNEGFRRLAGYIFGANHARTTIAMTAPVAQSRAAQSRAAQSRTIAMTAPVAQEKAESGYVIRFFMPPEFTMQTLPVPDDPAVRLVPVPAEMVAVLRFTGSTAPDAVAGKGAELLQALGSGRWQPAGQPVGWFYDPPWTLPFLRRNEVAVGVSTR